MKYEEYKEYVKEVSYDEAKEQAINYFIESFKLNNNTLDYGFFLDNPFYPANERLYNEFYDKQDDYFYYEAFNDYIIRIIRNHSDETGLDIYKSYDDNGNEILTLIEK